MPDIVQQVQNAQQRAATGDHLAVKELIELTPHLLAYVDQLRQDQAEWIEPPRLKLGKITATSDPA